FPAGKPRIVKEPDDVELDDAGPVYFKCQAEGDPEPRIVWLKEGLEELSPGEPGYELMSDGTLMVEAPSMEPVGAYACIAKSAMGEAKSRVARLVTNKRRERPDIVRPPRDWQAAPGDTVTLDCRAVGAPPPVVSWTLNGTPVAHSPRSLIATDGTLVLTGLRADEAGEYRCTASNTLGTASAAASVVINVAPRISTRPDNLTVKAGGTVLLRCRVDGSPRPSVAWFKDGRAVTAASPRTTISNTGEELRVEHAKQADGGVYVCRAENAVGSAETTAGVQVISQGISQVRGRLRLVHHPFNMEAMVGTSVEIPCSAEADGGQPLLSWRKDGQSVTLGPRLRVGRVGSLRIYNVTLEDAGLYECIATDGAEEVSATGLLAVRGDVPAASPGPGPLVAPGDPFVRQAFGEASLAVDRAVNATLRAFQQAERNHATLYRSIRFPDASARDLARAADVFEKTLINIRRHVEAGMKMNVTQDFNYTELLSPQQLQLVANLSGCLAHRPTVDCSDMCFHLKYRTVDGTCNNLQHPMWGASLTGFRRVLRPQYENGLSTPIGWNKNVKYFGYAKPSARLVSTSIIKTDVITPDPSITHMVMQWGQFLDHDLDHAIPSETSTSWDGIDCKKSCDYAAPCYPIEVPPNDPRVNNRRCIDFIRSSAICGSGQTSVLFDGMQPREQINQLTAFVDASQVYGFSDEQARGLRNLSNELGRLREGPAYQFSDKPYLPFPNPGEAMDCRRDPAESDIRCFLAGDIRANEQVGLLAMHTIWFREHNRVADELRKVNPHWDGDTLYHEARKIVGAEVQHITFKHWLPTVLGPKGMEMMGDYQGYNPSVNPGISNAFATAALRFGHSLINPQLHRLNESYMPIPEGHLPLGKAFFSPWRLVVEGGVDPLLRGLIHTPAKLKTPSQTLNAGLTEQLFTVAHAVALDLAAINIQRGRDHGLPEYNAYREKCGLASAITFDDLRHEISSQEVRDKLKELYGHPGNVDLWVGGILEDQVDGAKVGPTFRCLLVEQFKRLRDGDRFYYENPAVFKPEQVTQIKQTTLARVLCDNGDKMTHLQRDVFYLEKSENLLSCDTWDIPRLEFRFWAECCQDCRAAGQFSSLGRTFYRGVRRYRRELNEHSPHQATDWQNEDDDALNMALDIGLGLDDDLGEERIEGLETAIESFQKAVRQLRRKLRRLEGRCTRGQGLGRGRGRGRADAEGETMKCSPVSCPQLSCTDTVQQPGECCPKCRTSSAPVP
ncbi:Peroxidasin, partial [Frankliniella fusca]